MIDVTYPVNLIVAGRSCLVVGAGNVAINKINGLLSANAKVTVIAPEIRPEIRLLDVEIYERPYAAGEAASYRLVITCTDDASVNKQVFTDGEAAGIWVNSADDVENCAWILPSVTRTKHLTIGVSTGGKSPAMAQWMRRKFTTEFDHRYDDVLDLLAEVRTEARQELGTSEIRGWQEALDNGVFQLVANGQRAQAHALLRKYLGLTEKSS